ncbi:hypothetical protein JIQ42_07353 [Leishmania sp. Namibia]|uniref:hypothetical protein n=1 Tax=Leishmania sp. Namibia TaxID=2802991 RepID=UPI001B77EC46|nr:hypothetical protein JIQ42_07353 [Leishmania sp. Namibia]
MQLSAFTTASLPPPPSAASPSLLSRAHTTATTVASTSLLSTTGSTAAYCSTAHSCRLTDADHGTPGSVLGGVHDTNASHPAAAVVTVEDAGAAPLVSHLRAAATSRKAPRLLRCHAMTPMLLAAGDFMLCAQPEHLAAPSALAETSMSTASATSTPTSDGGPPASSFATTPRHTPPPPPPPGPQQRELRKPWCIRRSGVPYIEQMRQRCRTATALTQQRLVTPQCSSRVSCASASSPSRPAAVVMPRPRGSLSAPLSPASYRGVGCSGHVSMLGLHLPVGSMPTELLQLHWSRQGRTPATPGASSDADDRRSPGLSGGGLLETAGGGQEEESDSSAPTPQAVLSEPHEHHTDDHDRGMGADDSALHRVVLPTQPRGPASTSPSVNKDAPASLVASAGRRVLTHSTIEPARHTHNPSFSHSLYSGDRSPSWTCRKQRPDVGSFYWAEHVFLGCPLSRSPVVAAEGALRPAGDRSAPAAAATAPHAPPSREGGVPSPSLSRWRPVPQTQSYLSSPSSAAGTAAAPLPSSVRPGSSPTLQQQQQQQQQQHTPLLPVSPTTPGASSPSSNTDATAGVTVAGGSNLSALPLVFTAIEPAYADMSFSSDGVHSFQEARQISLASSASSTSSHLSHSDNRGDSLERVLMFQQHPFSKSSVVAFAPATWLPSFRTTSPRGGAGDANNRIAEADSAAAAPRAAANTAVVDRDPQHCVHNRYSHLPDGEAMAAVAVASEKMRLPRSSVLQRQQRPPLLLESAEVQRPPDVQSLLAYLPAASPICETPPHRQQRPPAERHCPAEDAHARHPESRVGRTVKATAEVMLMPPADSAVLLVVPGGVSSVPAAAIAAITSFSADAPRWGNGAPADAALALIEDVEEGSSKEGRLLTSGRRMSGSAGGPGSAEYAAEQVITYFPVHKAIVAQRSAYFAALLGQGSGCGLYVRSTPDEYVDLADLSTVTTAVAPSEAHLCRAGGAGGTCPMTTKSPHVSRCLANPSRDTATVKRTFNALHDTEGAHSTATTGLQRVPVYCIPTPATVAGFRAESSCARPGRDGAYSCISTGDSAAAVPPPTLSQACVTQLIHYLYTGVLPIFHQLPERTGVSEREPAAAFGITQQPDSLRNHIANEYAALLWIGLYTDLSSLTSSMLKLLWQVLALSRDVWPYWIAAAHWGVLEMQSICEAWIEQHLCAILRAPTTQGQWRGLRLDQVQLLVRLRKEALEAEARAAQASPAGSDAPPRNAPGHIASAGHTAVESSATRPTATMPSFLWEQMSNDGTASLTGGSGAVGEGTAEQHHDQLPLRPSVSSVAAMRWPGEVLVCEQLHPLRLRGGASGSGVGASGLSSLHSGAAHVSPADNHRLSPVHEGTPDLSRDAAGSLPPLEPRPAFAFSTPPPALDSVSFPTATAAVASGLLSRQSSRARASLFPLNASAALQGFRSISGRPAALGAATAMATGVGPSSAALVFGDWSDVDDAQAVEGSDDTAMIAAGARGHRAVLERGGASGVVIRSAGPTARVAAPTAAGTAFAVGARQACRDAAVLRPAASDVRTFAQSGMPARAHAAALRIELHRLRLTTRGFHDFISDARAELRGPSPGLHVAHSPIISGDAYYATPRWVVTQPAMQLLADGAWEVGDCGRLYTAETREELEQLQAYWYNAEWQQQPHTSAVLLTEAEVLERLGTWWRARAEDSPNQLTQAEVQTMAEVLQDALLSGVKAALLCTSALDDAGYRSSRATLDEERQIVSARDVGLRKAASATVPSSR